MPSGWDVYYVVFLSAALALGIPAGLSALAAWIRVRSQVPRHRVVTSHSGAGTASEPKLARRLNTRFFRGANAALLLIAVGLILIPCVGLYQPERDARHEGGRALVGILSLAGFAALGLLYAARKGDLDWLKNFQDEDRS